MNAKNIQSRKLLQSSLGTRKPNGSRKGANSNTLLIECHPLTYCVGCLKNPYQHFGCLLSILFEQSKKWLGYRSHIFTKRAIPVKNPVPIPTKKPCPEIHFGLCPLMSNFEDEAFHKDEYFPHNMMHWMISPCLSNLKEWRPITDCWILWIQPGALVE